MKSDVRDGDSDEGKGTITAVMPEAYSSAAVDSLHACPVSSNPISLHRTGDAVAS
jgi:hypothetical protein